MKAKIFSIFKYLKFLNNNTRSKSTHTQTLPIFWECLGSESGLLFIQDRHVSRMSPDYILQPS